jgi:hypothetical protein
MGIGKSGGAIGFALIFLLLFLSRKKVYSALFFQEKRWLQETSGMLCLQQVRLWRPRVTLNLQQQ